MSSDKYTTNKQIDELFGEIQLEKRKSKYRKYITPNENNDIVTAKDFNKFKKHRTGKIIGNIIFSVIVIALLVILAFVIYMKSTGETPSIFGYRFFTVETESMVPTLPVGTIVITHEVTEYELELRSGDIITFKDGKDTITHRIVQVIKDEKGLRYITKGDSKYNSADLEPVYPQNIIGRMVGKIPLSGLFSS